MDQASTTPQPETVELQEAFERLQLGYAGHRLPTAKERKAWLKTLRSLVRANQDRLCEAVSADFGTRSPFETLGAELLVIDNAIVWLLDHLDELMTGGRRRTGVLFLPAWSEIRVQPKGVVGVISPWNYPIQLALVPLAAALAAGDRVFLKPSELVPRTSALLAELLHGAFPDDLVRVVQGGPEVGAAFTQLPFDHLVFTGSTAVGRKVMAAAAANLVPVTLELGGKSPAIVHPGASLSHAVDRIAWGKFLNAGQTCIAVDYVLVPRLQQAAFVERLLATVRRFYGDEPGTNPDYTSILAERHLARLEALVGEAEAGGATVHRVGSPEVARASGKLVPTVLEGVDLGARVMQEEIFGPVLPVIPYDTLDEAIAFVNARPRPLALYYFDRNQGRIDAVLEQTHAGGVCIDDVVLHVAQDDLPFGGIGPSGMGATHGPEGFLSLSHPKPVFHQRRIRFTKLFDPPYGRTLKVLLKGLLG